MLDQAGLKFITLRARNKKTTDQLEALPDSAWTQITLERRGPYSKPEIHEQDVTVRGCPTPLRQIAVRGLGHDHPTLILTNDRQSTPKAIVGRYAKRMRIEQRLAESIQSFHLDALSSAVALNVDLDTTLTVWAAATYDYLRQRLRGYQTATPDTIWRRFTSTSGQITITPTGVTCRLNSRTLQPRHAQRRPPRTRDPVVGRTPPTLRIRLTRVAPPRPGQPGADSLFGNPS